MMFVPDQTLVVASHNPGKVTEIGALLAPHSLKVRSAAELNLPEPDENGTSFAANATIKASAACNATGLTAIADDSGLVVPILSGAPGIYSARWAGSGKDFKVAIARLEQELGTRDPTAHFVCALAVAWPHGPCDIFEGKVFGSVSFPPRGENGFGYDPIFQPRGGVQTFGEMHPEEKDVISHRASAFAKLRKKYFDVGSDVLDNNIN